VSYTQHSIPDQTGKVAVVTGANGGLGLETARALAAKGAQVVMAVRDQEKAAAAVDAILADHPDARLELVALDLGSLESVRSAADTILAGQPQIDLLVNNAGVMATPEQQTKDGFERQLGTNHLGHWALTAHLMPALLAAQGARVVTVTSVARFQGGPVDPENPHLHGGYDPWVAYGQSKRANYVFGLGLHREFERAGVAAISLVAHPGLSNTDLQTTTLAAGNTGRSAEFWHQAAARLGMPAAKGALPQLRAATDPAARGGQLYGPRFGFSGAAVRHPVLRRVDDEKIDGLWAVSERETGIPLVVERG
jgi:NAD(P)-dependent dehydrogenase (short-subunit alcohol dehydrogenase family)